MMQFMLEESVAFTICSSCKFYEQCEEICPMVAGERRKDGVWYLQCLHYVDAVSGENFKTKLASKSTKDYYRFIEEQNKYLIQRLRSIMEEDSFQ